MVLNLTMKYTSLLPQVRNKLAHGDALDNHSLQYIPLTTVLVDIKHLLS